jgi:chromosomal replication initiation ATPase DnaA
MRQIALPLDELRPGHAASLIITESNAACAASLSNAAQWPGRCAILYGPVRSGKSLMARYFATKVDGVVIEDAEKAGEAALFNAWNRSQETQRPLLLISQFAPADWQISLPDLRSRLASAMLITIPPPDDEMIAQLIQKHLADRGTSMGIEALQYATRRITRQYSDVENFARDANALALAENGPVNLALVKRLIA